MAEELEWKIGELDAKVKGNDKDYQDKMKFLERDCNSLRRKIEEHDDEMRNMRRKMASLQVSLVVADTSVTEP